ncbi:histidine phosphatase family protein [Demequina sp. NBRC 110053]|uniref:histidine phosphatase family protein n=1 Tax=Demequina sp. NBRC 110053 TaxID=1570342 RepID=UPI0009FBEBC5|nr:histidine phosphatase family protein [Demequina sp. NBRC 110053]
MTEHEHEHDTGPDAGPEYDDTAEDGRPDGSSTATPRTRDRSLFSVEDGDLVSPLTLVLVRHGVTDMTLTHALSGSAVAGPALNSQGRIQVAKAADAVYGIGRRSWDRVPHVTRVLASPMTRTQETGAAIGRRIGAHVETEPRVREIDFGAWEGLTSDDVAQRDGDAIHRWRFGEIPAPGGESIPDVGARFDEFLRDAAREHAALCEREDVARAWAVASHAVAIKSAVGISLAMDSAHWGSIWPQPASMTILQLRVRGDGQIVERHVLCVGAPTG